MIVRMIMSMRVIMAMLMVAMCLPARVRVLTETHCRSRRLGFPAWHPGDRVRVWVDGPVNALERDAD